MLELITKEPDDARIPGLGHEDDSEMATESEESQSNHSENSDTDSGFETAYREIRSAAWKSQQTRAPLSSNIDFDVLNCRVLRYCPGDLQSFQNMTGLESSFNRLVKVSRLRLINVLTGNVEIIQEPQRYVALSYVWGRSSLQTGTVLRSALTLTNNDAWSINWQLVPRTIRDARQFVRQLGVLYLWVDSLCIDQEDKEDKCGIIPEMTSIYGCAHVTLVAVAGTDAHSGLPGVCDVSRRPDTRLSFISYGKEVWLVPKRPTCFSLVHRSTWNTRSWTYQEYLLSPRVIFVTEVEAFIVIGNHLLSERFIDQRIAATTTTPESTVNIPKPTAAKLMAHEALIKPAPPLWSH